MKIFFIGICGISMSALAVLASERGYDVCGCDQNYKRPPKCLIERGIKVLKEKEFKKLIYADMVVYSSAIKEDHPALRMAKELKKICITRGQFLGDIANRYEKVIAIAGSHGKTTTTAMIYHCLAVAGKNPTLHLGGIYNNVGSNIVVGGGEYFICEACEYCDNFLYLYPYVGVVTNIESEHLDYFKTFEREKKSFQKFKSNCKQVVENCHYKASNIRINRLKGVSFSILVNGKKLTRIDMRIGGFFNVKNALFTFQVCRNLGIKIEIIKLALDTFSGIQKRLDYKKYLGKEIIVDYAHHPTEIKGALDYIKRLKKRVRLIFQPHTFSRTKNYLNNFVSILSEVDELFLFETYPARECSWEGVSSKELCDKIKSNGCNVTYLEKVCDVKKLIKLQKDDELTVVMGAGNLPEELGIY